MSLLSLFKCRRFDDRDLISEEEHLSSLRWIPKVLNSFELVAFLHYDGILVKYLSYASL